MEIANKCNYFIFAVVTQVAQAHQPYLGLNVGSDFFTARQTITALNIPGQVKRPHSVNGFVADLIAGVDVLKKGACKINAEAFGGYHIGATNIQNTLSGPPFVGNLKQKLTYNVGIRALPTYEMNPHVDLFTLVGFEQKQLKSESEDGVVEGPSGVRRINFNGLQLGGGAVVALADNWKLRVQGHYAMYAGKTTTTSSNGLNQLPIRIKMSPYAILFSVGLFKAPSI